jgi:hypothetical protein
MEGIFCATAPQAVAAIVRMIPEGALVGEEMGF